MELAYGAASLHIPFPDERIDCVVTSKAADIRPEADVARLVDAAMAHPIGCPPLEERIHANERVCILVSDVTRLWQRTAEYMPLLDSAMWGILLSVLPEVRLICSDCPR